MRRRKVRGVTRLAVLTGLIAVLSGCGASAPSGSTGASGAGVTPMTGSAGAGATDAPLADAAATEVASSRDGSPVDDDGGSGPDVGGEPTVEETGGDSSPDAAGDVNDGAAMPIPGACTPPVDIDHPYEKLSQTGCVDSKAPTRSAALVLGYEVNSPLWSDGAAKTRGIVVPAGGKIHVKDCAQNPAECKGMADDGKWVLPVGTVMVKNFLFDGKFVETRLFVHFDEMTWVGYGYRWDEAQTDATIVPDQRVMVDFNTGTRVVAWTYPHRLDCMQCHAPEAGSTLGLETAQMNRVVNGTNQLDRLAALGLFEKPPAKPYKAPLVAPYAIPGQLAGPPPGATVDERARSYLHANCGFCHRPGGAFEIIDLRFDVAMKDRNICDATPDKGDCGVIGALNLTPGDPMKSTMWLRMKSLTDMIRMPQIASVVVDQGGVDLIGQWIASTTTCPM
jgi:uncharacterized repeat protein (TIGR03806 family)